MSNLNGEATVFSTSQVPAMQLSQDGTNATGPTNARCDASGNMKVNVAAGSISTSPATSSALANMLTVSVTNTATSLLASNATRKGFIIVNNGSVNVYVGFSSSVVSGATAQANGGFLLVANGGAFSMINASYTGVVQAITASSTSVVGVLEW